MGMHLWDRCLSSDYAIWTIVPLSGNYQNILFTSWKKRNVIEKRFSNINAIIQASPLTLIQILSNNDSTHGFDFVFEWVKRFGLIWLSWRFVYLFAFVSVKEIIFCIQTLLFIFDWFHWNVNRHWIRGMNVTAIANSTRNYTISAFSQIGLLIFRLEQRKIQYTRPILHQIHYIAFNDMLEKCFKFSLHAWNETVALFFRFSLLFFLADHFSDSNFTNPYMHQCLCLFFFLVNYINKF